MKILIAHNAYQYHGGEDAVVEAEAKLLRQHGHQVELYLRSNDELNSMSMPKAAMAAVWSRQSAAELDQRCDELQPELVHVHSAFHAGRSIAEGHRHRPAGKRGGAGVQRKLSRLSAAA